MSTPPTTDQTVRALRLTEADNIVVAIDALTPGEPVFGILPKERVPRGHKMAVVAIARDAPVVKYGQVIGFATSDIAPGDWVHEKNVRVQSFDRAYVHGTEARPTEFVPEGQRQTFQGFRRANGRYGTRNYVAVLTSVNCSASAARHIARRVEASGVLTDYPNIDGVISLVLSLIHI
jgi:altronate hydrolase